MAAEMQLFYENGPEMRKTDWAAFSAAFFHYLLERTSSKIYEAREVSIHFEIFSSASLLPMHGKSNSQS